MKYPLIRNSFNRDDLKSVIDLLQQDDPRLTNGPRVLEFEEAWSNWLGVKHSVFVNSGSSANLLSLTALKILYPSGGEVIVPALTWISDIASVIQTGFTPIFVDIDLSTLGMDNNKVVEAITSDTKAVFLSHIQGFNGLSENLLGTLEERGVLLIEDVCESHGATHDGRKLGSLGWMSNFSFYYAHHMSTIEGGMICTDDTAVYEQLRMLRSHGMVREIGNEVSQKMWIDQFPDLNPQFIFAFPAYNVRNTEIGATLGLSQLKKLDDNILIRNRNFEHFLAKLDKQKFLTKFKIEGSSNYAFNLILREPDQGLMRRICASLEKNEIEYRLGSAGGGNQLRQPYLRDILPCPNYFEQFPVAEHVHFYGCYIGNFPELEIDDVEFICSVINNA